MIGKFAFALFALSGVMGIGLIWKDELFGPAKPVPATVDREKALEYPVTFDAGPIKNSDFAEVPIPIRNRSSIPVVLDSFKTDCSCIKITLKKGSVREAISSILLQPGESTEVTLVLRSSGQSGMSQATSIDFRLDGEPPLFHRVAIKYTPVATLYTVPKILALGEVEMNKPIETTIEVRSDGSFTESLEKVVAVHPKGCEIRFVPATKEEVDELLKDGTGQYVLGRLIARFTPMEAGRIIEDLVVFDGMTERLRVPIIGNVATPYRFSPDTPVLPRRSAEGEAVFRTMVVATSRDGKPFELAIKPVDESPVVLKVTKLNQGESHRIQVEYTGEPPKVAKRFSFDAEFSNGTSTYKTKLEVAVYPAS